MGRFTGLILTGARVVQTVLGFIAVGFSVALCQPDTTSLAISVSAAYCSGGIALCGILSTLALSQKPHIHWAMVLLLDLLGLFACGGAAGVLTYATIIPWWDYYTFDNPSLLYPPLVMAYICMAILLVLSVRSLMFWIRGYRSAPTEVQTKDIYTNESWYKPVEQEYVQPQPQQYQRSQTPVRFSQDRFADGKSIASPRPLSTVESMAYWSDVSGGATLTQAPSIRSSDTKRPPSYASPVPSRAPTTVHRKPLN